MQDSQPIRWRGTDLRQGSCAIKVQDSYKRLQRDSKQFLINLSLQSIHWDSELKSWRSEPRNEKTGITIRRYQDLFKNYLFPYGHRRSPRRGVHDRRTDGVCRCCRGELHGSSQRPPPSPAIGRVSVEGAPGIFGMAPTEWTSAARGGVPVASESTGLPLGWPWPRG